MKRLQQNILFFFLFALFGLPLLYYAYKYGTAEFGGSDVYAYLKLYDNWDYAAVDSPFNQRLISSWFIHLIHLSGFNYNTETAVAATGIDPQVYFCALFFNFMCVVATACVIRVTVKRFISDSALYSFLAGITFLLGFGTILFLISALSDAFSVLLLALIFYFYLRKSNWQYLFLLLAVFQREYIFMVFGLMAVVEWCFRKEERRYFLMVAVANALCFALYIWLRQTVFFTPRYEHQMNVLGFADKIANSITDIGAYVRQTFLLQNLLFLYLGVVAYKMMKKMEFSKVHLSVVLLLLLEIIILSLLIGLGNNTGRYYYMCAPIIIYYLALEAKPLFFNRETSNKIA